MLRKGAVLAVFVLGSLLGSSWCLAADTRPSREAHQWIQLKERLLGSWEMSNWMRSFWAGLGCEWDPYGQCRTSTTLELGNNTESQEIGCMLDPYGRCMM